MLRAPEVILGAEWTYKVDIWNLGLVVSCVPADASLAPGLLTSTYIVMGGLRRPNPLRRLLDPDRNLHCRGSPGADDGYPWRHARVITYAFNKEGGIL